MVDTWWIPATSAELRGSGEREPCSARDVAQDMQPFYFDSLLYFPRALPQAELVTEED